MTNANERLTKDIQNAQSVSIVGFFLDTDGREYIETDYRKAALERAGRFITGDNASEEDKNYLRVLIDNIAEEDEDELHTDAKEFQVSIADETELSEIALNEDEEYEMRVKAIGRMTDRDKLLDIATDAEDDDVRQAAKARVKELG